MEHRPGAKIPHADALSRHVAAIEQGEPLSRKNILEQQRQDEFCKRQVTGNGPEKNEFFLDQEGLLYRHREPNHHQLVVPKNLIQEVIKENHNPVYAGHPGIKRTHQLLSQRYWWPGMRRSIEDYVKKCDSCQRYKGDREFTAPLGGVDAPRAPFEVTHLDITGPYPTTPRGNRYLLTFIDKFTKYAEAYPIKEQSAEACARVYASQIITRHGTGSKLITDQGSAFMSAFFSETCKILGIRKVHTSSYHPQSNSSVERLHRSLHTGLAHYVDATHTNWDLLIPFFNGIPRYSQHDYRLQSFLLVAWNRDEPSE